MVHSPSRTLLVHLEVKTLKSSTSWMWSHAMPEILSTVQCSWHAHSHLKQFDIEEDALTLWIFLVRLHHYKGLACHFISLKLNYINDNQQHHVHNTDLLVVVSLLQLQSCINKKVLKVVEEMLYHCGQKVLCWLFWHVGVCPWTFSQKAFRKSGDIA